MALENATAWELEVASYGLAPHQESEARVWCEDAGDDPDALTQAQIVAHLDAYLADVAARVAKLDAIEPGAQANTVSSVNGQMGAVVLDDDHLSNTSDLAGDTVMDALNSVDARLNATQTAIDVFMVKKAALQTTTVSYATITSWGTPTHDPASLTFDSATGELTVNTTGTYYMSIQVVGTLSASARAELDLQVQLDGGSGFADVSGAWAANYAARQTAENQGGVSLAGFVIDLAAGDKLRVQVRHATTAMRTTAYWSMLKVA